MAGAGPARLSTPDRPVILRGASARRAGSARPAPHEGPAMVRCTRALVAVGLAVAVGCGPGAKPQPSAEPPKDRPSAEQLRGRLEAALGITDPVRQGEALRVVARDAADAGAGDIVLQAVKRITDVAARNEVAADCAVRLARSGDPKGANLVTDQITDPAKRNEVRAKVAEGR